MFVAVRGDQDVDEEKLNAVLGGVVTIADVKLMEKHGFVAGFAGYKNVKNSGSVISIIDLSL